jgi:hypothetical protein
MVHGISQSILKIKRVIPKIQFSGAMLDRCEVEKHRFMKVVFGFPASCDGPGK